MPILNNQSEKNKQVIKDKNKLQEIIKRHIKNPFLSDQDIKDFKDIAKRNNKTIKGDGLEIDKDGEVKNISKKTNMEKNNALY